MNQQVSIEAQLENLERSLLQASIRESEHISQLLAEGFIEFGSSGRVFTKEQIIATLREEPTTERSATEMKVQLLAPHVALVTYCAQRHTEPPVRTLRSSIWEQRQGKWQMVFHQGTLLSEPH